MNCHRLYSELEKYCENSEFANVNGIMELVLLSAKEILSDKQLRIFEAFCTEKTTQAQIAKRLGVSPSTVDRALERSFENIRSMIVFFIG